MTMNIRDDQYPGWFDFGREEEGNRKETGEEMFPSLVIKLSMEGLILLPGHE